MITTVRWPRAPEHEAPFERKGRNLRATLYCPRPFELGPEDSFKSSLIREFARLESLEIADTDEHAVWKLELENADEKQTHVRVSGPQGSCRDMRANMSKDGSEYLASPVFLRALRALQARDEIGCRFYERQNNATRDLMIYHFDYLTMLLTGAFDAQARVAARAYSVDDVKRQQISFRQEDFCRRLDKKGARELYALLSSERFTAFQLLLKSLRNSVHAVVARGRFEPCERGLFDRGFRERRHQRLLPPARPRKTAIARSSAAT